MLQSRSKHEGVVENGGFLLLGSDVSWPSPVTVLRRDGREGSSLAETLLRPRAALGLKLSVRGHVHVNLVDHRLRHRTGLAKKGARPAPHPPASSASA